MTGLMLTRYCSVTDSDFQRRSNLRYIWHYVCLSVCMFLI